MKPNLCRTAKLLAPIAFLVVGTFLFLPTLFRGALNSAQSDFTTYYYATKWAFSLPFKHPYSNLAPLYPFFYLPAALVFFRPLNLLPYSAAVFIWTAVSFVAFVCGLFLLFKSLEQLGLGFSKLQQSLMFLALSFFYPLKFTLLSGQANAVIFFCLAAAFYFYLQEQDLLVGLCLALGTILKISPAILLLYFLIKRRWKIFLWGIFFIVLFSLGAEFSVRWDKSINWHYFRHVVHHVSDQGGPHYRDQSLLSFIAQFKNFWDGLYSHYLEDCFGNFLSGRRFQALVNYAIVGVSSLPLWLLSLRQRDASRKNKRNLLEYSLFVILGIVGTGLCWYHQYTMLILPLLSALAIVLKMKPGILRAVFLGLLSSIFLAWAINWEPLTFARGYEPRFLTSIMFYGSFALYLALFYFRIKL